MAIRIVIGEAQSLILESLHAFLHQQSDFQVIADCDNGFSALQRVQELGPDVVVLDWELPGLNGVEVTHRLSESTSTAHVIVLATYCDIDHAASALQAGADAYVLKSASGQELVDSIRAAVQNRHCVSPPITDQLVRLIAARTEPWHLRSPLETLSQREREVLQLVVEGHSSTEIATILHLSPGTIDTYRSRLMTKLHIDNLVELVKFSIRHGLISTG